MPVSTLFLLEREPLKPAHDRTEPVLWLKRLVILSALDSSAVIRDIEFRRGLNIIQTRQMETQGGPVAGHSVGKTLLMRLIRYTLGEPHFGTDDTQHALAATRGLETALVVAHWSVVGSDWIVVRPLKTAETQESFAARTNSWKPVIEQAQRDHSHREFIQAVNDAVLSTLPPFKLPRGREAKWLDLLPWLSRDYQCGYRKANEWRHEDANSGPSLDREDNSLIMQWTMGLMSADEIELRIKHRELLDKQADEKRSCERDQRKLETLRPGLWEKLELNDDAEVVGEQATFASVDPKQRSDHESTAQSSLGTRFGCGDNRGCIETLHGLLSRPHCDPEAVVFHESSGNADEVQLRHSSLRPVLSKCNERRGVAVGRRRD